MRELQKCAVCEIMMSSRKQSPCVSRPVQEEQDVQRMQSVTGVSPVERERESEARTGCIRMARTGYAWNPNLWHSLDSTCSKVQNDTARWGTDTARKYTMQRQCVGQMHVAMGIQLRRTSLFDEP